MSAEDDAAQRLNLLVAFPYINPPMTRTLVEAQDCSRILVDSGAFTAYNAGKVVTLDDYCRFLEALPFKPWRYFTLDVIGDAEASMRNYETMLQRGFKPLPIFTRGEKPEMLDRYYETSDVVGVGGLVKSKDNKGFVNGIMKRVAGRKVHWLGFTNLDYIKTYRPFMCDSSNWMSSAMYGSFWLYFGRGQALKVDKRVHFAKRPPQMVTEAIRSLGFAVADLMRNEGWSGEQSASKRIAGASAIAESLDVQKACGTLLFLATPTASYAEVLVKQYRRLAALKDWKP